MSRAKIIENTAATAAKGAHHEKILHALSLSIFSDNGVEAGSALHELLKWSTQICIDMNQLPLGTLPYPQPTPLLIESLTKFVENHLTKWTKGQSADLVLSALTIIHNLTYSSDKKPIIPNDVMIASTPNIMKLLLRLSYHPYSVLSNISMSILGQLGRFCYISKVFGDDADEYVSNLCSLLTLANPATDKEHIKIFTSFAILPENCRLFIDNMGAGVMVNRLAQLLTYPSGFIRDTILESIYLFCMTNADFKDATCSSNYMLRSLLGLTIPPSQPYEINPKVPFTPCQKACVLLLELSDDPRVLSFLANYKIQIADAMLKWKSNSLPQLALKVSNASVR